MDDKEKGEAGNDQAPSSAKGIGKGSSGSPRREGSVTSAQPNPTDPPEREGHHQDPPAAAGGGESGPPPPGSGSTGRSFESEGSFYFQPGADDSVPSGDFQQFDDDPAEESVSEDDPFEEEDQSTLPLALLSELAAKEKDTELRKFLYKEFSRAMQKWREHQHAYVMKVYDDRKRERAFRLKKYKVAKRLQLRAGFGEMFGNLVERVVPVVQTFLEWALPAAMVFLLAKWMTSSYWMKSEEAARSLKELMVMIMAGALGWAARSGFKDRKGKNPPTPEHTEED